MTALTLDQASTIVDKALEKGRELNLQPLTVVVLDAGGQLKAMKREDRSSLLRPEIAMGKAWGTLGMGFGGREFARRVAAGNTAFIQALTVGIGRAHRPGSRRRADPRHGRRDHRRGRHQRRYLGQGRDLRRVRHHLRRPDPGYRRPGLTVRRPGSAAAARTAAEDAEFRAMRVVERHAAERAGEARPEIEPLVVGQQRAGDHGRPRRALELDDHPRTRAHHVLRRLAENAPAAFGDLGHVGRLVHLREYGQRERIVAVDRDPQFAEQPGKAAPDLGLALAR